MFILKTRLVHSIRWLYQNLELVFWISAVFALLFIEPGTQHFTICPLHNAGFEYCPGCGLGRSCAMALRGNIVGSLSMHPLGVFALLVIFHRIFTLVANSIKFNHPKTNQL